LGTMSFADLKAACTDRGIPTERTKVACKNKIIEWQTNNPPDVEQNEGEVEDEPEVAEQVEVERQQPQGQALVLVGTKKRSRLNTEGVEEVGPKELEQPDVKRRATERPLTQGQLNEILAKETNHADLEARVEIRKMLIKKSADDYYPNMELKKLKLQHEYDSLRDIGRAVMVCEAAESEMERVELFACVKQLITARAAAIVTADKEGWGIAQFIEAERPNFLQDTKALVKEARSKFKKGDVRYRAGTNRSSRIFNNNTTTTSTSASSSDNSFFRPHPVGGNRTNNFPRQGTPSGKRNFNSRRPIQCYSCKGPHLQKNCPQNKK
jgi:hypothetical protein